MAGRPALDATRRSTMSTHVPETLRRPRTRRRAGRWTGLLVLAVAAVAAGCGHGPSEATDTTGAAVDRETFISTYVDLRTAAIRSRPDSLAPQARARILGDHGVTEDGLLQFVQAHGEDVSYMRDVWDDVEKRLDSVRLGEDATDIRR
jgi:hypothetical protein